MSRPAVIVTGGARRVGAAIVRHFADNGYDIALHYNKSEAEAKALQKEIKAKGVDCQLFAQDLSQISRLDGLITKIYEAMPNVTALINNASVFERASFLETDEALFDRQFDANFKAPFFLTQAFAKHVAKGSVINILDTDIVQTYVSHFAYLLSKKSLAEFTVMAARALGPNVRVNAVSPGCMLPSDQNDTSYEDKIKSIIPLKSHPELEELSATVLWLVVQKHITGQTIYVDGGKHVI
jgi:NAD(P)-dependent dehydrogenase (short-subunit alcohol dehydrogenase family)